MKEKEKVEKEKEGKEQEENKIRNEQDVKSSKMLVHRVSTPKIVLKSMCHLVSPHIAAFLMKELPTTRIQYQEHWRRRSALTTAPISDQWWLRLL